MATLNQSSYETLSAMITPALFLTANGSLIISTSNRLARITDRIHGLNHQLDDLGRAPAGLDFVPERIKLTEDLLGRVARRSDHVRMAMILLYLALAAFAGTSLTLAIDVWAWHRIFFLPTALAVLGVTLLLGACVRLVREALAALKGNDREVRFYRDLQARRIALAATRGDGEPARLNDPASTVRMTVLPPTPSAPLEPSP